ncbi:MAG: NACHT domain-containing protein [Leptolyngbya sp. LCM1.Bin17]|nr:MAG: NACHT domain-containing protein [Leptolyngbya sp. LCM1.Bin17]
MTKPTAPDPSPERRHVQKAVDTLIQWSPLGGSGWAFVHFLLQQEWVMAMLTFPAMVVTAVWARYTGNFTARLGEIAGDRGTQDADALANWLSNIDQALRWHTANPNIKYLKCQADECLYNEVEGYRQPEDIKVPLLEEVFVPLELSGTFSLNPDGDVIPMQMGSNHPDADKLLAKQLKQGSLNIWDLLIRAQKDPAYRQLAILAWGGYGKTTLMKHVTFTYARQRQRRYKAPKLIPVLLYLRKWRDVIAQAEAPSLPDLIANHHIPGLPGGQNLTLPTRWAVTLLRQGQMLVMLDGFDEVAEGQRQAVSQWISQQMGDYPRAHFILTSRPGGYKDYSGTHRPKRTVFVKPLKPSQWEAFIHRWYLCQERESRSDSQRHLAAVKAIATQAADDLIQQIHQREELATMATNPLLLNMISTFHRFYPGEELPQQRATLYQAICQLQLGARPEYKRIAMPLGANECQLVLQKVALAMVKHNKPRVHHQPLTQLLSRCLAHDDSPVNASDFLDCIVKVSELLVEREPQEYEFSHLSFMGYLAAAEVKRLNQETLLLENWDKAWWQETILLYAAQVNPTRLIRALSRQGAVDLAYRCLQESPTTDPALEAELQLVKAQVTAQRHQKLEEFLKNGQWKEADKETYRLMITTVGKEDGQVFEPDELLNFPCEELLAIDGLWVKYSQGKFGFSVQKKIYAEAGNPLDGKYHEKTWRVFCDRVGWRKDGKYLSYKDLKANPSLSPIGEFPHVWGVGHSGLSPVPFYLPEYGFLDTEISFACSVLFSRAENCEL